MKRSKHLSLFLSALTGIFITSTVFYGIRADKYSDYIEYSNQRAMSDLISELSQMDSALAKLRYASTPLSIQTTSAKLWQSAENAKSAMAVLSLDGGTLDKTQKFIAQAGDFAYFLLFSSAEGNSMSLEHSEALDSLYNTSDTLARELSSLKKQIDSDHLSFGGITQSTASDAAPISDSLSGVEQEFPEYAELIYDGPFSEHVERRKPKLLEGMKEISPEEAIKNASAFSGISPAQLSIVYEHDGNIPSYCVTASDGTVMEVSKQGGIIYTYHKERAASAHVLSPEEAIEKGSVFLNAHGFSNMNESYYTVYENHIAVNYAYKQNDITLYPDLIKITVALDNGEILGMEARGYVMCHTDRSLEPPLFSVEEGGLRISPDLTIESNRLALIPTSGENEVLCYEYVCTNENGEHIIIYVNALTGQEENIYMLIEDENGILAI
ncbi:MAG: germination protein YpeB [Clostridia bacterium]|nr:germination protein YpeB [Clostridia bacterium]